jgi:hypothetical protein
MDPGCEALGAEYLVSLAKYVGLAKDEDSAKGSSQGDGTAQCGMGQDMCCMLLVHRQEHFSRWLLEGCYCNFNQASGVEQGL